MKNNHKGFALIEGILIILIFGALAGVGWYVYKNQNTETSTDEYTYGANSVSAEDNESEPEVKSIDLEFDQNIAFIEKSDASQLPDTTPSSFKAFFEDVLAGNNSDSKGCVSKYSISKIKSNEIYAGVLTVNANTKEAGDSCGGAAGFRWFLHGGEWKQISTQVLSYCTNPSSDDENLCTMYQNKDSL